MDDLVIRGGMILDGTGAEPVRADLAVRDGRIAAIAPRTRVRPDGVVDARGQIVAPGFIDIKTHSDFTLPYAPRAESKVLQGVTTEVVGPLRVLARAGGAGPGAPPPGVPGGLRALDRDPGDHVRRLPGHVPRDDGQHHHAGRPQHAAAHDGRDGRSRADPGRDDGHAPAPGRGARRGRARHVVRPLHGAGLVRRGGRAARPARRGPGARRRVRDAPPERVGRRLRGGARGDRGLRADGACTCRSST